MINKSALPAKTLYWHDYETFGTDPKRDRPAQFAGIRTDEALNIIGEPLMVYCQPANDMLPYPQACLVTGITPQTAMQNGVPECVFIGKIHAELAYPGTCGVGYNSIRFDDEFTRYSLYRNFFDPYAREWQNGNSRWDIIDMARLTYALRPEGIQWPTHANGEPSFKLEDLTSANGIDHEGAHDALADVYATIAFAKCIRSAQPKLYQYLYRLRSKHEVAKLLNVHNKKPVLHTSGMYLAKYGRTAMVLPLAMAPNNKNGVIVYDLRYDPKPLLELDVAEIQARMFTPNDELPQGMTRIPLKTVHMNKSPALAPLGTLDAQSAERLEIDIAASMAHAETIKREQQLPAKVARVFAGKTFAPENDPDHNLYGGGFFADTDRIKMDAVRACSPAELGQLKLQFKDARLPEMLFRYRARNYPETLSTDERVRWETYRIARLHDSAGGGGITHADYLRTIASLKTDCSDRDAKILAALEDYGHAI